jgi:Cd2+/Zn2+-exporting ATPase
MGGIGSDAALEAADIVLMTDDLSKISAALSIARKTRAIVIQNIAFSLFVKALLLILGALGRINLWWAVFGDVGVSVLAVFNAMRAGIKVNKDNTARISDNTITG